MEYQSNMQKSNLPSQYMPAQNTTDLVTKLRSFGSRKNFMWLLERKAKWIRQFLVWFTSVVLGLLKESCGISCGLGCLFSWYEQPSQVNYRYL